MILSRLVRIPVVRLERVDCSERIIAHAGKDADAVFRSLEVDRERRPPRRLKSMTEDQLPGEVVEGRTDVVEEIPDYRTEICGEIRDLAKADDDFAFFMAPLQEDRSLMRLQHRLGHGLHVGQVVSGAVELLLHAAELRGETVDVVRSGVDDCEDMRSAGRHSSVEVLASEGCPRPRLRS